MTQQQANALNLQVNSQNEISLDDTNQLIKMANILCKSEALPPTYKSPANVLVALQTGKEMGLQPMQALNGLYIVNGSVNIYGSTQTFLLKKHGWRVATKDHDQKSCTVIVTRGSGEEKEEYEYTTNFADLPTKSAAKGFAPKEKLYYHCISRIIRFYLPEVLGGNHIYTEFDQEDIKSNQSINTVDAVEETELYKFITNEVKDIESLKKVKSQLKTEEEKVAYEAKLEELGEPTLVTNETNSK